METGIIGSAQVAFYLIFIAEHLQPTAGHEEFLTLRCHSVIAQQVLEQFEIASFVNARILRDLPEVGEGTPLALLMGDDGRLVGL